MSLSNIFTRDDGCSNSSWAATPDAYIAAQTDESVRQWWNSQPSQSNFAQQLARPFGDQPTQFVCGIGQIATCIISGCKPFDNARDPVWSYEALISVVNINTYANNIYDGVINGQVDFTDHIPNIALNFSPPSDTEYLFGDISPWLAAILVVVFSFGALTVTALEPELSAAIAGSFGALGGAGLQMGADMNVPGPSGGSSVLEMQTFAASFGSHTRKMLSDWANGTFHGAQDADNRTILDYMKNGAFVDASVIPPPEKIENFYAGQMIARTINSKYRIQPVFGMFTKTDSNNYHGPYQTRYYSDEDQGVIYIYQFYETAVLQSKLDKPAGLDQLNGSMFNITGQNIAESSYKAFKVARYNYTTQVAQQFLDDVVASDGSSNSSGDPWNEGAAWAGTWTIPICDTGYHDWNIQFGDTSTRYGRLPCCCGDKCADTKDFVAAANLVGSQTFLRGCYEQLLGTDLDFEKIDYGFSWETSFPLTWALWGTGIRAGVGIGFCVGAIVVLCCICSVFGR